VPTIPIERSVPVIGAACIMTQAMTPFVIGTYSHPIQKILWWSTIWSLSFLILTAVMELHTSHWLTEIYLKNNNKRDSYTVDSATGGTIASEFGDCTFPISPTVGNR
jgi:hypothetical protein